MPFTSNGGLTGLLQRETNYSDVSRSGTSCSLERITISFLQALPLLSVINSISLALLPALFRIFIGFL